MPNQEKQNLPLEPQARQLSARFQPVVVRHVTPVDAAWGEMGVEFVLPDGSTVACRLDVQQARSLFEDLGQALGAYEARTDHKKPVPKADYATDDYPREGCTIVVDLSADKYAWRVYRPDVRVVASSMAMESYAPRHIGSIGISMHAFLHRPSSEQQAVLREMSEAEKAYQCLSESRSTVTV